MGNTLIEWTEKVWNAVTGCSKVSQGCKNCYAERIFSRPYPGRAFTDVRCHEDRLDAPLHWRKPSMIFVNSMSDLFHEKVPFEFIDKVFAAMALCPQHTFQILTKRPERAVEYFAQLKAVADEWAPKTKSGTFTPSDVLNLRHVARNTIDGHTYGNAFPYHPWPLPNVWLGVSVEDQKTADERIPLLLQTPAAVRWVSYEPALGPVDFNRWLRIAWQCSGCRNYFSGGLLKVCPSCGREDYWSGSHAFNPPGRQVGSGLNWLVCGGESGPGARPMHPDWARSVRDQCVAAGVPFFFKQWGEFQPLAGLDGERYENWAVDMDRVVAIAGDGRLVSDDAWHLAPRGAWAMQRVGKSAAGRVLDGREWSEYPAVAR